jgi:PAS domain-containing protein
VAVTDATGQIVYVNDAAVSLLRVDGPEDLLNAAPGSVDALHRSARRGFRRLGRRAQLLHSFFHHAGLSVN